MNPQDILKKLLVQNTHLFQNVPENLQPLFNSLENHSADGADFALLFADSLEELHGLIEEALSKRAADSIFWACYKKGSSKRNSNINRNTLFDAVHKFGLRPVTQVTVDDVWYGLRLRPEGQVRQKPGQ